MSEIRENVRSLHKEEFRSSLVTFLENGPEAVACLTDPISDRKIGTFLLPVIQAVQSLQVSKDPTPHNFMLMRDVILPQEHWPTVVYLGQA